jgi:hypothetical protein
MNKIHGFKALKYDKDIEVVRVDYINEWLEKYHQPLVDALSKISLSSDVLAQTIAKEALKKIEKTNAEPTL